MAKPGEGEGKNVLYEPLPLHKMKGRGLKSTFTTRRRPMARRFHLPDGARAGTKANLSADDPA